MRVIATGVLLGSDVARVVLSRMGIKTLAGVAKVRAHLGSAILAHLGLVATIGLWWHRRSRFSTLTEVVRVHGRGHSVRHAA